MRMKEEEEGEEEEENSARRGDPKPFRMGDCG